MHGGKNTVQKCYNCGKEVDDNVLICPECGALVKRYGKPEPQQAEPFESQGTAFTQPPQPHAAVWQLEDGKLKFSGGVTFWLVLCAIFLGYTLLGFACTLFIYRFQAAYFQTISQFQELAPLAELLQALLASVEAYPVYYLAVAALVALQFGCVIWFLNKLAEEVEKAHPDVFNVLLQILDDGRLTDGKGRVVNFKNTVIIMTSNLGSHEILSKEYGEAEQTVKEILKDYFRPEFLNRIDETIMFLPLTKKQIGGVVELQLNRVKKMLEPQGFNLQWTPQAVDFLADVGYDPEFGARPVKRAIQKYVLNDLSKSLLAEKVNRDKPIIIDSFGDGLVFRN